MSKRMLVDSTHPEETRVVVLSGNRLEEFDFETSTKKQIKGNIYLAKITRVEPSLQAAFVDYGGNRHGFLPFSEIHSDYYRIPVSDRYQDRARGGAGGGERTAIPEAEDEPAPELASEAAASPTEETAQEPGPSPDTQEIGTGEAISATPTWSESRAADSPEETAAGAEPAGEIGSVAPEETPPFPQVALARIEAPTLRDEPPMIEGVGEAADAGEAAAPFGEPAPAPDEAAAGSGAPPVEGQAPAEPIEIIGGDEIEEASRQRARRHRPYKIQEVIKRRQIMLIQVTKEERGNKGAALTTYLSLAGRYCVLMPNTDRGGGVSRKITSAADRKRLKDLVDELQVPDGMGIIVRTAGSERSRAEIKRDFEYLMRLWDEIREFTLKSTAPALIYEEGNLIKRSIRDLYTRDIDEVIVEGDDGYHAAREFMKMLMPSHAKRVHHYLDATVPLFQRFQVESQIDAILSPTVQLKSGGYIVINQAEALVAIDVNSGRATRERNIEETALKTNIEAADEIARQLRLRDLAGLIVVDFIDMEEHRNQVTVERRLKEAMKHDRARIQVGRISAFGLLEMSRQRLRPSIVEVSTQPCPHCGGTGHIRSTESTALHVLRAIEEEGMRRRSAEIAVAVPANVSLYILNQKRTALAEIEKRYHFRVSVTPDESLVPPNMRLERVRGLTAAELASLPAPATHAPTFAAEPDDVELPNEEEAPLEAAAPEVVEQPQIPRHDGDQARPQHPGGDGGHGQGGRGRRRRRRGRRGGEERRESHRAPEPMQEAPRHPEPGPEPAQPSAAAPAASAPETVGSEAAGTRPEHYGQGSGEPHQGDGDGMQRKRRRRGRRGGRRRRRGGDRGELPSEGVNPEAAQYERAADRPRHQEPASNIDADRRGHEEREPSRPREAPEPPPVARVAAPEVQEKSQPPAASAGGGSSNVPPPISVTERPTNPKRGWWHRLTQS